MLAKVRWFATLLKIARIGTFISIGAAWAGRRPYMSQRRQLREGNRAIARVLRELRVRKGVPQLTLAEEAGISHSHYGKLERGKYTPEYATIEKLADYHGMSTLDLLGLVEYCRKHPRRQVPG